MNAYSQKPLIGAPVVPKFTFSDEVIQAYADMVMRDPHNRYGSALEICSGDHIQAQRLLHETNNNNEFTRLVFALRKQTTPEARVKSKEALMEEVNAFYSTCESPTIKLQAMKFYAELGGFLQPEQTNVNVQLHVMQVPDMKTANVWEHDALAHQQQLQDEAEVINESTNIE